MDQSYYSICHFMVRLFIHTVYCIQLQPLHEWIQYELWNVLIIGLTDQSYYSICHFMVRLFILTVQTKYNHNNLFSYYTNTYKLALSHSVMYVRILTITFYNVVIQNVRTKSNHKRCSNVFF